MKRGIVGIATAYTIVMLCCAFGGVGSNTGSAPITCILQSDCSGVVTNGQQCYNISTHKFYIGNGTAAVLQESASDISGTTGYIPKFTGANALGNSPIYTDGTNVGIGTTAEYKFDILGIDNAFSSRGVFHRFSRTGSDPHVECFYNGIPSANSLLGRIKFMAKNTGYVEREFAGIVGFAEDASAGSEDGYIVFRTTSGGLAEQERMRITSAGNVGIGTTLAGGTNPIMTGKLNVWGGSTGVWDPATLNTESLTNGALTSGTSWTQTNDCALTGNAATWTFSAGTASTLSQAANTLAVAGVPNRWYKLVYTVSGITGTPSASVTTAFASASTALTLTAGTQTTYLKSAAAPGAFTITSTLIAGQAFTLDTLSLTEVSGGSIASGAEIKLGPQIIATGTTGNQTMNRAAGRVNAAAGTTSLTVTNNLCTTSSIVSALAAAADATGYVTSAVSGNGSFVIHYAAPTGEMAINWMLFN